MISIAGTLAAPFPWFGGKANACETVWQAFGAVDNYVEPFAGSAAMLLGAPEGTCGDWSRVVKDSVTTRHGLTAVFLDPPYTKGSMDYSAGGVGGALADEVREWCAKNGDNKALRIVLCGHAGEHDSLIASGWKTRAWIARKGYALTDEAVANSASETVWCSPHCVPEMVVRDLFTEAV
jgi:site-specific DNA-adenine methylase